MVGGVKTKIMCVSFFRSFFLTRRGIEGGGVIIRHVVRESTVGRPFPVTVVPIINFGVIVVAAAVAGAVLVIVLQILTTGLAAIHRRQTAAQKRTIKTIVSKRCATTTTTTTTTTSLLKIFYSHPLIPLRKRR